jgi:hypothetical protein
MSNYLIIDWISTGHRIDYLNEIDQYLIKKNKKAILFFPKTKIKKYKKIEKKFFKFNYHFTNSVFNKVIKKFFILQKISQYVKKDTKIIFLHLDSSFLSIIIFKIFNYFKNYRISGILMRPEIHYLKYFNIKVNIKKRIMYALKHFFIKILLKLKVKVYSLDYKYSEYTNNRVKYLEDFVPIEKTSKILPVFTPKNWINSKNRILLFGYLDSRKGIFELMKCLYKINPKKTNILFVGKVEQSVLKYLKITKRKYKNFNFIDKYIELNDLSSLVYNADKIYAAYINFSGVSNVFNWAKTLNKKIIVSNYGVMAFEAKKYKKSIIINKLNVNNLVKAIEEKNIPRNLKKFLIINNKPKNNFSKKLLEN